MQIKLSIACDPTPGILAKVIVAMRRAGVKIVEQHGTQRENDHLLELTVEGTEAESSHFEDVVKVVRGVNSVESEAVHSFNADEEPLTHATDSEVATRISQVYPDIQEIIDAQIEHYDNSEVAAQMYSIGVQVSALRKDSFPAVTDGSELSDVINNRVLPDIADLGKSEYDGKSLKVLSSIFTKSSKKKKSGFGFSLGAIESDSAKCDFLCGYMQGILDNTLGSENLEVKETFCRKEGQPFCQFDFSNK